MNVIHMEIKPHTVSAAVDATVSVSGLKLKASLTEEY